MSPVECQHKSVIRALDIPGQYGHQRSQVCLDCKHFRVTDDHSRPLGPWLKILVYLRDVQKDPYTG